MNKTPNIFAYYNFTEVVKATALFLLGSVVPLIALIIATINIVLLMIPSYYYVITVMSVIMVLILAFSSHLFVRTLQNIKNLEKVDYKKVFFYLFIPTSMLVVTLAIIISSIII